MLQKIGDKVSVSLLYDHMKGISIPRHMKWRSQVYAIDKLGLHYTLYRGRTLVHMFSVCNSTHCFLLAFNATTLSWTLEEIADENTN
jgi:hypothetical protein